MKTLLTSILCMAGAFCITYFVLQNFSDSSAISKTSDKQGIETNTLTTSNSSSLDFSDTIADFEKWKTYDQENVDLNSDFIAVNLKGEEITKKEFLERLKTGNYIPVKLFEADNMYQLYSLESSTDEKIKKSIKNKSSEVYGNYLKEGTDFPEFDFTDLNGNNYTSANTKAQYVVIECWFVQCPQCIQEFPDLNDLYDKYEDQEDVLFFSLAFDNPEKIKKLLTKKEFRFPVVADQKDFIKNKIKPSKYPVHIVLDKDGTIYKVLNNIESLKLTLNQIVNGDIINDELL